MTERQITVPTSKRNSLTVPPTDYGGGPSVAATPPTNLIVIQLYGANVHLVCWIHCLDGFGLRRARDMDSDGFGFQTSPEPVWRRRPHQNALLNQILRQIGSRRQAQGDQIGVWRHQTGGNSLA
eukprot:sb/3475760/